ncbi:hypothetical protein E4U22_004694 [Claviceps purpurea]|nr:hypothetical protein E4U22_004694 [Claviceps purpurea]
MTVHFQLHCLLSTHQTTLTLPVTNGYFSISFGEDILSFDDCGRGRPFVKGVLERILVAHLRKTAKSCQPTKLSQVPCRLGTVGFSCSGHLFELAVCAGSATQSFLVSLCFSLLPQSVYHMYINPPSSPT